MRSGGGEDAHLFDIGEGGGSHERSNGGIGVTGAQPGIAEGLEPGIAMTLAVGGRDGIDRVGEMAEPGRRGIILPAIVATIVTTELSVTGRDYIAKMRTVYAGQESKQMVRRSSTESSATTVFGAGAAGQLPAGCCWARTHTAGYGNTASRFMM
jgi:hypothetical protein